MPDANTLFNIAERLSGSFGIALLATYYAQRVRITGCRSRRCTTACWCWPRRPRLARWPRWACGVARWAHRQNETLIQGDPHGRRHHRPAAQSTSRSGSTHRAAPSARRWKPRSRSWPASPAELTMTIGGQQRMGGGERIDVVAAAQPPARARPPGATPTDAGRGRRDRRGRRGRPGLAGAVVRRPGGDLPQGRRPAGRPVAGHHQRGHHPGPVQVGVPGRDRRRLRADRLLAVQRALRPAAAGRAAAVRPGRAGTGWSTGRWKASCWPSRRSTSPRSRATCPPRPRCSATSWCGSRRPPSSCPRTTRCGCWRRPGCRPGVINLVTGDGQAVSRVALPHPDLAGIHFTGSTATFQHLWRTVGENIAGYRGYPRLVGETGGKDFVIAHPSADPDVLATALVRGAFEYQGQKCSAASRAYVPRSVWRRMARRLPGPGGVADHGRRVGRPVAVHGRGHRRARVRQARRRAGQRAEPAVDPGADRRRHRRRRGLLRPADRAGVRRPRRTRCSRTEYFGPILAVHVYDDAGTPRWWPRRPTSPRTR